MKVWDIFEYRIEACKELNQNVNVDKLNSACLAAQYYILNNKKRHNSIFNSKLLEESHKKFGLTEGVNIGKFVVIDLVRDFYYDLGREVINHQGNLLKDPAVSRILRVQNGEAAGSGTKIAPKTISSIRSAKGDMLKYKIVSDYPIVIKSDKDMPAIAQAFKELSSSKIRLSGVTVDMVRPLVNTIKEAHIEKCELVSPHISSAQKREIDKACSEARRFNRIQQNCERIG